MKARSHTLGRVNLHEEKKTLCFGKNKDHSKPVSRHQVEGLFVTLLFCLEYCSSCMGSSKKGSKVNVEDTFSFSDALLQCRQQGERLSCDVQSHP